MSFTQDEIEYIRTQPVGRIATVATDGQPDTVPVGIEYDGTYFYLGGGHKPERTRKYLNVDAGNTKVALLWDDVVRTSPWTPRFLRVYGTGDFVEHTGMFGPGLYLRVTPTVSWSWNLEALPFDGSDDRRFEPRRTVHRVDAESAA
ncbi:PPOX class F420-dependent oxidoreductase [Kribbella turkmenica]|uniref:PPOX class F420-dependent oxidoreductase n=1 Tax=Kribbella turkmenica TaxID=2530375 RepID=A0A4R4WBT9_9ACTN|nr:PPOX class F420-dependent oxidoreductase [Kribbella turkmenica]TDD16272.1 PPOX class F420-dependent oxidoreductase [Kribbella turkmenica]